jgi:competence ComEA-like helix-hairpin-helix protein
MRMTKTLFCCLLLAGCASETVDRLGTLSSAVTINVPGDYSSIQEALNSAQWGDVILVAPGEYTESVTVHSGLTLQGSGPDQTVLHGQIRFFGSDFATVTGFHVISTETPVFSPPFGIVANGEEFKIIGNVVEGFKTCIEVESETIGEVRGNLVRRCGFGIMLFEIGSAVTVSDNLVLNNSGSGIILFNYAEPLIYHNTIVGNGFGDSFDEGGSGISIGPINHEKVQNNIVVSNNGGINSLQDSNPENHHNLVWGNVVNYVGDAAVGEGDLLFDPDFVDPSAKDYRLRANSPAINAGIATPVTVDYTGNPRLFGAAPDLGAYEFQGINEGDDLIINEVLANPVDEHKGEFIELYNPTSGTKDAAGLRLSDGDSTDIIVAYGGGSTQVPAGGYAVILDPDYGQLSSPYDIPAGAVRLTTPDSALGSGLSVSDPVTISRDGSVISSWLHPFNPGDGLSAERIDPAAPDGPGNWGTSSCGMSPGERNCLTTGGTPGAPTLVITEVMANPAVSAEEEFVEVFNYGANPVDLAGLKLSDGDSTDPLVTVTGKTSLLPAGQHGIIIDPDLVARMTGPPYYLDAQVPVVVTVDDTAIGNGLARDDPVSILVADETAVVATYSHPIPTTNQSVERIDVDTPDVPDNWTPSPCTAGHSAGRPNCAYGPVDPVEPPPLVINEFMSNPVDEDTGEFVELYNQGSQAVDAAGLVISDGDATDVLGAFPGSSTTLIPAGGYALILDPEYAGEYTIPAGTVLLAPQNTTIGNGLATTDPITLYAPDGLTVVSSCSFPFNPGNGISVERKGDTGDVETNWVASPCPTGASPGAPNCAATGVIPARSQLTISEVMANPEDEAKGEFVEIKNVGTESFDLTGYFISDGDASDTLEGYAGGSALLAPGGYAVILDRDYGDIAAPYDIPAGTVLLTVDDASIGSGLSTDDPVTLLKPDGYTALSTFQHPFNPGNGTSAERIDLSASDTPDNWIASPCPQGSSPGRQNCAETNQPGTVVDVNTASADDLTQVTGIGPATAAAIIAYRDTNGAYESLLQLTVNDGITPDRVADWMVSEEGESEYTIGLPGAKELLVFHTVSDLLAALPSPSNPGTWDGQPVRIQRATAFEGSDVETQQDHLFGDWGDEYDFYPNGAAQIPVFLDKARTAMSYLRDQTDHANAMDDWTKDDGDPYLTPDFYRWQSPLWSFGRIAYAHVFSLEGVVEVDQSAWRLRIRAKTDPGIDRMVMIERWLIPSEWAVLQTVWTYSYKSVVIDSTSSLSYSLPYRLALGHPARPYWYDTHGVWIDIPRCPRFGECQPCVADWNLFNQALAEWTP